MHNVMDLNLALPATCCMHLAAGEFPCHGPLCLVDHAAYLKSHCLRRPEVAWLVAGDSCQMLWSCSWRGWRMPMLTNWPKL